VAAVVVLAGCGSQGTVKAAPETVIGTLPKPTQEPATPAFKLKGDPTAGKGDFTKAGCGACHTLADAGSTGTVGPNLDQRSPTNGPRPRGSRPASRRCRPSRDS